MDFQNNVVTKLINLELHLRAEAQKVPEGSLCLCGRESLYLCKICKNGLCCYVGCDITKICDSCDGYTCNKCIINIDDFTAYCSDCTQ